jgi:hypothetical protein
MPRPDSTDKNRGNKLGPVEFRIAESCDKEEEMNAGLF